MSKESAYTQGVEGKGRNKWEISIAPVDDEVEEVIEVDELTLVKQQLEEEQDRMVRLRADFENFKRRVQKDKEADYKYRAQSLLSDLLPVLK